MEKTHVSGVAKDKNVARLALMGLADRPGIAFKIFSLLAKQNINVDIILQSIGRDGARTSASPWPAATPRRPRSILEENKDYIGLRSIEVNDQVAKVSIVGAGMINNPGVAWRGAAAPGGPRPEPSFDLGRRGHRPGVPAGPCQ